jgi:predicted butyrate kinase (DUF1464 family)
MIFAGVDPGSESYAIAFVDELGRLVKYIEIPTDMIIKDSYRLIKYINDLKPSVVALPSGHGLPFIKSTQINEREIFYMTLADPNTEGHLRSFLRASMLLNLAYTIPSVKELNSVPEYRKINVIDMGTADKVASAFFYRTIFDSFVLIEVGRKFSALIVVIRGKIIDGLGGTFFGIPGPLDGELAYILHKYGNITKEIIYNLLDSNRGLELLRMVAEWYSIKYDIPIIISGPRKDVINFGIKMEFKYKEAALGAAYIANAIGGGIFREYLEMLKSSGTSLSFIRIKGWKEIIHLIETLYLTKTETYM